MTTIAIVEKGTSVELVPGSIKKAMKETESGSRDLWQVDPSVIRVIDGFNPRLNTPKHKARIRELADSMKTEGFYQDHPLGCYVAKVDGEDVIFLYSGHTRLAAVLLAIKEGAEIQKVPVAISQSGVSMEDLTVALVRGNSGSPLTVYETAVVCKRLARYGWESPEIAKRLGFTEQHVNNLLSLMAAPVQIRKMVADDIVAASLAIEMIAQHGDKALAKLEEAIAKANGEGKARLTKRHVEGASYKKFLKKKSETMAVTLNSVKSDPAFASLNAETREIIESLIAEIDSIKAGEPVAADPRQMSIDDGTA